MPTVATARKALRARADAKRAKAARRYFKTGPGGYGEGDRFIGVPVPDVRAVARAHRDLPLSALTKLLRSPVHEERLLALVIAAERSKKADGGERDAIARWYLKNLAHVDNWDLVDTSAPHILGPYFEHRSRKPLHRLSRARSVWRRRVAVLTTAHFIRAGDPGETLALARALLQDPHDLIHKAVGWMLREVGQRDGAALKRFLDQHAYEMPRTMLRYAMERLPEQRRKAYMAATRPRG